MMTQSVMTQTASLSLTPAAASAPRVKQNKSGFELFMDRNISNTDSSDAQTNTLAVHRKDKTAETETVKSKQTVEKDGSNRLEKDAASNRDKAVKEEDQAQMAATQADQSKSAAERAQAAQASEEIPEDMTAAGKEDECLGLLEQLSVLMQTLRQALMEQLQLSPEEFETLLKEQGLGLADLTDPEGLQQLLMARKGSNDVLDFLTDSKLKEELDRLLQRVENILKEADLKLSADQLKAALEQLALRSGQEAELKTEADGKRSEQLAAGVKEDKDELAVKTKEKETEEGGANSPKLEVLRETERENGSRQTASEQKKEAFDQKAEDNYETFLNNLARTGQEKEPEPMVEARATEIREIANQILERIRVVMKPEETSMEMVLHPEELGKVNLTVVSKDGTLTANFKVQNELARQAIESQLQTLKETLNAQGIKVEAIEVAVAGYSFEQSKGSGEDDQAEGRDKSSGHKLTLEEALNMSELPEEEGGPADITGIRGSNIDMTA